MLPSTENRATLSWKQWAMRPAELRRRKGRLGRKRYRTRRQHIRERS